MQNKGKVSCHENALGKSFKTSPHLIYLYHYFKIHLSSASGSGLDEAGRKVILSGTDTYVKLGLVSMILMGAFS